MPSSKELDELVGSLRARLQEGASLSDIVAELHGSGLTIIESIRVVREACSTSLGQAKVIVTSHPVWAKVVRAAEPLHDDVEEIFRQREIETGKAPTTRR